MTYKKSSSSPPPFVSRINKILKMVEEAHEDMDVMIKDIREIKIMIGLSNEHFDKEIKKLQEEEEIVMVAPEELNNNNSWFY